MTKDADLQIAADVIAAVRARQPLVHCISAAVSADVVANGLLAAGARPVMTETIEEAPAMTQAADALLINLGMLSRAAAEAIPVCAALGHEFGKAWVLDPTAVGVAPIRTHLATDLLALKPTAIRGNASEILAVAGERRAGRGADSGDDVADALSAAQTLALRTRGVVAVSGPIDLIVDADRIQRLARGHQLLTRVTGSGCLLGALSAACVAVWQDAFSGVLAATLWLSIAGERAARLASRPGAFRMHLLDQLDAIGEECE